MLERFFHKIKRDIHLLSVGITMAYYSLFRGAVMIFLGIGTGVPPWNTALGAAAFGTVFNEHREKTPVEGGCLKRYFHYKNLFNYYGFKNHKGWMGAAFSVGAVAGGLAGEFAKWATGDPVSGNIVGNIVAAPLSYGVSAFISATPPGPVDSADTAVSDGPANTKPEPVSGPDPSDRIMNILPPYPM
jgi:hypothetical protein